MSSFSSSSASGSSSAAVPIRMGVTFKPPALVLLYTDGKDNKVRRRVMPVRNVGKNTDCYQEAGNLKRRHEAHLGRVPAVTVEKFLRLLQETMKGSAVEAALEDIKRDFAIDLDEDMNKLSDADLQRRKELMEVNFAKNQIKVGDPGFVWDKKVDFSQEPRVESGWDDEDGGVQDEEEDFWG